MDLKTELLKSIWYAFTSLDLEKCGNVSKSQLKVLSHNLYTVLNIPHDPVALEEHFQDNDNGPVSNHGYMPYLNTYILAKVKEGGYDKETFDEFCWMMTSKKNFKGISSEGLCSPKTCFKLFCLFNLLSEDQYPLVMVPAEVEYLLKKITTAMSLEWDGTLLGDLLSHDASLQEGMSVWVFLEQMHAGKLLRVSSKEGFNMAVNDVFQEMYHNVLKKGYMWKKGHVRRNWMERWFVLRPSCMAYYASEDLKDKKGEILLDKTSGVETLPDREGKRCLFCVKTPSRNFEMSATDHKQKVEWIQAMQTAIRLLREGKPSAHHELKLRRRELRRQQRHGSAAEELSAQEQQKELQEQQKELQEQQIESIIQHQRELDARHREEEKREKEEQKEVQRALEKQLKEAERVRESMVAEMLTKEKEAQQQRQRIQELELIQNKLEIALSTEIQARMEEEKARLELRSLLQAEEEKQKLCFLIQAEEEKQEAVEGTSSREEPLPGGEERPAAVALHSASQELQTLRETREKSHQNLEEAQEKLRKATTNVKHWNIQLNRLMTPIMPGDRMDQRLLVKGGCPKQERALTSSEFLTKCQPGFGKLPGSQSSQDEEEGLQEQLEAVSLSDEEGSDKKTNGKTQ